jgi:hypothetical protein
MYIVYLTSLKYCQLPPVTNVCMRIPMHVVHCMHSAAVVHCTWHVQAPLKCCVGVHMYPLATCPVPEVLQHNLVCGGHNKGLLMTMQTELNHCHDGTSAPRSTVGN